MSTLALRIHLQNGDLKRLLDLKVVHTHNGPFATLDLALESRRSVGDLLLEVTGLNRGNHAAQRIDLLEVLVDLALEIVRQLLDEVGAAQRVNRVDRA